MSKAPVLVSSQGGGAVPGEALTKRAGGVQRFMAVSTKSWRYVRIQKMELQTLMAADVIVDVEWSGGGAVY